jgi:hypothetical protein
MYIIDDKYFQSPKREVPNLDEADSRAFAELELLIDEKCRLLILSFLTFEQFTELDSYLADGILPTPPTGVPQKWIDLVNGVTYTKNDVELHWNGLIYTKGTYKGSLLADYVYYYWLTENVSYMTGVGDAKGNPKGANLVNPTQRVVNTWNEFVKTYQLIWTYSNGWNWFNYHLHEECYRQNQEVSLIQFLQDHDENYPNPNRKFFEVQNQLGL